MWVAARPAGCTSCSVRSLLPRPLDKMASQLFREIPRPRETGMGQPTFCICIYLGVLVYGHWSEGKWETEDLPVLQ